MKARIAILLNGTCGRTGLLLLIVSLTACSDGQVVEKGTNRPLEGAVVVGTRHGTIYGVVQNSHRCFHVAYSSSDAQGRFSRPHRPSMLLYSASVVAGYKPGYHMVETNYDDRIVMERHSDNPDVRFEQILSLMAAMPLDCPEDEVKELIDPILRPMYSELKPLVRTRSQFEKADAPLGVIDTLTLGMEAAHANWERRRAEWLRTHPGEY